MQRFTVLVSRASRPSGLATALSLSSAGVVRAVSPVAAVAVAVAVGASTTRVGPSSSAARAFSVSPVDAKDKTIVDVLSNERKRVADAPLAEYKSSSLSPTKRTQLVDHLVSSLAIEAAATEEILFPVLQDLVNEAKTTADDQAVKKEGKGDVKNVFESWVDQHQNLKLKLESINTARMSNDAAELDKAVGELMGHVATLTKFEDGHVYPLLKAHFNPDQLKFMAEDYLKVRDQVPHNPHPSLPKWLYEHPTMMQAFNRFERIADEVMGR